MSSSQIRIEFERDPKDSLRFYATFPDASLQKSAFRSSSLDIAEAESLLKAIRKRRALDGGKYVLNGPIGNWLKAHASGHVTTKEHSVSRKAAGGTPAHWRIGLAVIFAKPALAQAFATAFKIP